MELMDLGWSTFLTEVYPHFALNGIYGAIMAVVDLGLGYICGPGVSEMTILNTHMESVDTHLGSAVLLLFIAGPLVDMAETVRHACPLSEAY